ncbi:general stress protein [Timonella senegalensis]|uniref:general stress protein n=2 Tax=Timonella senegalensis TaxID=1465825 RepID=UPI00030DEC95|nr:general stress protein [Timonella senegalensis]
MSMMNPNVPPKVPTMPRGNEIAAYSTYLEAQKAVDTLSDEGFAVQSVTIVGHDLHTVERVTGRLTYPRVAFAGFASGAWFGLFVGLLLGMFGNGGQGPILLSAVLIGGAFGLLFSVLSYALTRGKRDFTSQSQIVAARYVLLCAPETAGKARALLMEKGVAGNSGVGAPAPAPQSSQPNPMAGRYGASAPSTQAPADARTPGAQQSGTPSTSQSDKAADLTAAPLRPRTYGEALDAQRRSERSPAAPAAAQAPPVVPAAPAAPVEDPQAPTTAIAPADAGHEGGHRAPSVPTPAELDASKDGEADAVEALAAAVVTDPAPAVPPVPEAVEGKDSGAQEQDSQPASQANDNPYQAKND